MKHVACHGMVDMCLSMTYRLLVFFVCYRFVLAVKMSHMCNVLLQSDGIISGHGKHSFGNRLHHVL